MAPYLKTVHNDSEKSVHIYMTASGDGYSLANNESKIINHSLSTTDSYSKINIEDPADDSKGYRLKYTGSNQTIYLNDIVGKNSGVADSRIFSWRSTISIYINIYINYIKIQCNSDHLGIFQSDGSILYYYTIDATMKEGGGLTLKGIRHGAERTKDKDEEGDGATQSTGETD
ncbi:hypothetical protein AtNW77_Chr1g0035731 [Arabidopsis thaliana]|uniref:(thale cress) hypothetical protein n=1 Tax=Arabidopsis thaliana TaxID=3702 RepID=A0A7G2DXC4_ARATH|nr:unnamed protein product [Arabidopsis thaliana]